MKKKIMNSINLIISVLVFAMATGCSAFRDSTETVAINCEPKDSILTVNGQRYVSPVSIELKRNRDFSIQCYKEGYMPYQRTITSHLSTTGVLDIIGIFIFILPGIGLFFPGAWDLDETNISVTLYPQK